MTAERTWPPADMELNDLGSGMFWTPTMHNGVWVGIIEWHRCVDPEGVLAAGGVLFQNAPESLKGARWTLECESPLTLSPSVLCRTCGLHGWIREGRWVPA